MSLRITRLEFHNFRNYEHLLLNEIAPVTVFVGENAIGKTNIIEGIQLLTSLQSFRHPRVEYLVREGFQTSALSTRLVDATRQLDVQLNIEDNRKKYFLNQKPKKPADLKGLLPAVIFTPNDLSLVKDSPSVRRDELDAFGEQLSKNHGLIKKDYDQVMKHKNKLLKDEADIVLIENINELLITCGAQLTCYRAALVRKMLPLLKDIYKEVSSGREELDAKYIPSWIGDENAPQNIEEYSRDEARAAIQQALEKKQQREIESHRCLVGPHLDKLVFTLNGKNASLFGSQGQQRCVVLTLKLAELMLFQEVLKQKPVLLLDDVMSELDAPRRNQFVSFIQKDTQVFITTTTMDYFQNNLLPDINEIKLPLKGLEGVR